MRKSGSQAGANRTYTAPLVSRPAWAQALDAARRHQLGRVDLTRRYLSASRGGSRAGA